MLSHAVLSPGEVGTDFTEYGTKAWRGQYMQTAQDLPGKGNIQTVLCVHALSSCYTEQTEADLIG